MGMPINTGLIYQNIGDKRRTTRVYGVDLVTSDDLPICIFPVRVAIIAVRYTVTILLTFAKAVVTMGLVAATEGDDLIAASDITASAVIGDTFTPTLATTLVDSAVPQAMGLPIFEAATLLILDSDGGPTAGELMVEVDYFELAE